MNTSSSTCWNKRVHGFRRRRRQLADSVQAYLRTMLPAVFPVPHLHTLDDPAGTGQINGPSAAIGGNAIADDQLFRRSIAEVHDDALEIDGAAAHAQLDGPESAVVPSDVNDVMILSAVYVSVAEKVQAVPAFLGI